MGGSNVSAESGKGAVNKPCRKCHKARTAEHFFDNGRYVFLFGRSHCGSNATVLQIYKLLTKACWRYPKNFDDLDRRS